jgi:hypothetical protein
MICTDDAWVALALVALVGALCSAVGAGYALGFTNGLDAAEERRPVHPGDFAATAPCELVAHGFSCPHGGVLRVDPERTELDCERDGRPVRCDKGLDP